MAKKLKPVSFNVLAHATKLGGVKWADNPGSLYMAPIRRHKTPSASSIQRTINRARKDAEDYHRP